MTTHIDTGEIRRTEGRESGEFNWRAVATIAGAIIGVLATLWLNSVSTTTAGIAQSVAQNARDAQSDAKRHEASIAMHAERLATLEASTKAESARLQRIEAAVDQQRETLQQILGILKSQPR